MTPTFVNLPCRRRLSASVGKISHRSDNQFNSQLQNRCFGKRQIWTTPFGVNWRREWWGDGVSQWPRPDVFCWHGYSKSHRLAGIIGLWIFEGEGGGGHFGYVALKLWKCHLVDFRPSPKNTGSHLKIQHLTSIGLYIRLGAISVAHVGSGQTYRHRYRHHDHTRQSAFLR